MKLDPIFEPLEFMPPLDLETLPQMRAGIAAMLASQPERLSDSVTIEDAVIGGPTGDIPIRIYYPKLAGTKGALLYFHGGGFVMGNLDSEHGRCLDYAEQAGCVVVSVDYRLAPEHPFPAAHDDAWLALNWLVEKAPAMDVDPRRIAVGGGSAGACIAAGLAIRARDVGEPVICFVLLTQPALDYRCSTYSARSFKDLPFFKGDMLPLVWRIYFGPTPPNGAALTYASPAVAANLVGFPPACVIIGDVDPTRDEALAFSVALVDAGTEVELHLLPGTPHGFDLVDEAPITQRMLAIRVTALKRAFSDTSTS